MNLIETTYETNGNIASKTDAGIYAYDTQKKNAVVHVDNDLEQISFNTQEILYTPSAKSARITEGDKRMYFTYGAQDERIMTKLVELDNGNENILLKKYFVGLYEKEMEGTTERHIYYIMAGDGLTAIAIQEDEDPAETYFTYKDHLGSIVTLTDDNGDVFSEQSFDAWGRYRNPDNWTYSNINEPPTWLRGYTGHEHLTQFDLVNMNGRMYDPKLGRMLRPDNFVPDPLFTQAYNRYAYAYNNPLKFTDPDGELPVPVIAGMVIGAIVGAYVGGAKANDSFNPMEWTWDGNTAKGIVLGASVGTVLGAYGGAAYAGLLGKAAKVIATSKAVKTGLLSGGLNALYNYESGQSFSTSLGYFGSGFAGGAVGGGYNLFLGMGISGSGNMLVHGAANNWDVSGREYAQKFVSGALSVYAGVSVFGDVNYMQVGKGTGVERSYFGGSKTVAKAWRAGWLNQASDFAHSSQDAFNNRSFGERLLMFGFAGVSSMISGVGQGYLDELTGKPIKKGLLLGARQLASGYFDYHFQQTIHSTFSNNPNYMPWQYKYKHTKLSITGYKALFYSLKIN